mmetsp:Transcript_34013/g.81767  ORF Transcript_34013/g.81767 Transcript_34013/m.81767 type:complete len:249 (-) Transcript_34013:71-817(-)
MSSTSGANGIGPARNASNGEESQEVVDDRKMNDTTMPPPPRPVSMSTEAKSVQSVSTAARTRPPKKVVQPAAVDVKARGPRFGLHDWKRLLVSAGDLAQRKGQPLRRDISRDEIAQHNKNHDGWIILRGNVYNVGPYLPYHPGGRSIFKNVLGKDGDVLFDKYHRWVNIDGLIGPLLIGTAAPPGGSSCSLMRNNNVYTVIPPKERSLGNAPRVPPKGSKGSSLLSDNNDDDQDDDNDDLLLPPPPKT